MMLLMQQQQQQAAAAGGFSPPPNVTAPAGMDSHMGGPNMGQPGPQQFGYGGSYGEFTVPGGGGAAEQSMLPVLHPSCKKPYSVFVSCVYLNTENKELML